MASPIITIRLSDEKYLFYQWNFNTETDCRQYDVNQSNNIIFDKPIPTSLHISAYIYMSQYMVKLCRTTCITNNFRVTINIYHCQWQCYNNNPTVDQTGWCQQRAHQSSNKTATSFTNPHVQCMFSVIFILTFALFAINTKLSWWEIELWPIWNHERTL